MRSPKGKESLIMRTQIEGLGEATVTLSQAGNIGKGWGQQGPSHHSQEGWIVL